MLKMKHAIMPIIYLEVSKFLYKITSNCTAIKQIFQ